MVEAFFGFKKAPFGDNPIPNSCSLRRPGIRSRHGCSSWSSITAGLITGEVGSGKSTAARSFTASLNPNLFKVMYLHWTPGSTLDLLRPRHKEERRSPWKDPPASRA
jgi:type II secretory pathway predicted ATPase ExeA